jgi:hypothetical protein
MPSPHVKELLKKSTGHESLYTTKYIYIYIYINKVYPKHTKTDRRGRDHSISKYDIGTAQSN